MKKLVLVFVILFSSNVMAQSYVWAKSMGGPDFDSGCAIAVDDSGNTYTTGSFQSTADFDPGIGISNLIAIGNDDIFISKLDASGNFMWAKSIGGSNDDHGISITTDASGNVYTTGFFSGTADFDPGIGISNLTVTGNYDIFISKLDANGNFVWAKKMGGTSQDIAYSINVDTSGNIYTTGAFSGIADFDPGSGVFNMTTNNSFDAFISKLDANGNFVWAKSMVGTQSVEGTSITTDATGNVYTTGFFRGIADFDPGIGINNLTSAAVSLDIYISKLDANGNFIWVKSLSGPNSGYVYSITTDTTGNVYTTGYFFGTFDFDPGVGISNHTATGGYDIFISKLDANGNFILAKIIGGIGTDTGRSMDLDAFGNMYITGTFQGTVDFDSGVGVTNLTSVGSTDIFISKLDTNGNFMWGIRMGGIGQDIAYSIDVDTSGNVYTTGAFRNTADFNPGTGISNNTTAGDFDVFASKLGLCQANSGIDSVLACGDYTWMDSITYVSNNNSATDTILSFNGCDSVVTLNLTINTVDTSVSQTNDSLMSNATGADYQWIDCNNGNSIIVGDTNQLFVATANGSYAVIVTQNGCTDTSTCVLITSVGVNKNSMQDNIYIYPNPTTTNFTIEGLTELYNLTIYNALGQILYTENNILDTSKRVDVSEFTKGLIFIRVESEGIVSHHKILKN
jgi:hypothetical protein